jgi:hypothetical protein
MYDLNAPLSAHYTLGQFVVTNQPLSQPNLPTEIAHYDNLVLLADMKERLDQYIGPSNIVSAYRTKELQEALRASGEPTASGKSFHELGRAFDIYPSNMSIADFFGKILASPLRSEFAEIAIKPAQNALHLSINVPGDVREPKVTGLNSQGSYVRLTADEIASYIQPFVENVEAAYEEAKSLVTYNKAPLYAALFLGLAGAFYLIYKQVIKKA